MKKEQIAEIILIISILLLGAFLRLYLIRDYLTFLGDEGRDVLVIKNIIVDHKFTLLGPTASVGGFFLGPIYYYFMIPFLWLFRFDPVGPAIMVALFNIAAIFLVYRVGKDFFDAKAGLIAALFYSVSPVVITYSRSSWNPNLVPFFTLLIIYLSRYIVVNNKWNKLFLLGLLFGISFQLHYLVSFLAIAIALYILYFGRLSKTKYYFLGILGFIIGLSPFLLFEVRHGFPNTISLFNFIFHGKEVGIAQSNLFFNISDVSLRLFNRLVAYNNAYLGIFLLVFSVFFLFFCFYKHRSDQNVIKTHLLLIIWGVVGIILFGFYKKAIYDYYLGFLFPLPFLLSGHFLSHVSAKPIGKIFTLILIAVVFIINWQGRPFRYPPNKQLDQTITISRAVLAKTDNKTFNFALITGQNSDHAYRYFFEIWGHKPQTIENLQIDPQRKSVTSQLLIVCEKVDCQPLGNSLWEVAGFGRAEIAGSWNVSVVKVYKLIHYQGK